MGEWKPLIKGKNGIIAYFRIYRDQKLLVLLNFSGKEKRVDLFFHESMKVIFSTMFKQNYFGGNLIKLQPFECIIFELMKDRAGKEGKKRKLI